MTRLATPEVGVSAGEAPAGLAGALARLQAVHRTGRTRSLEWRLAQLDGIARMLDEAELRIADALEQDLGPPTAEAWFGDIASTMGEVSYTRKHLRRWMRPARIGVGIR